MPSWCGILSNGLRTELIGQHFSLETVRPEHPEHPWALPQPGFHGTLYLGHETDIVDPLHVRLGIDGEAIQLRVVEHEWNPAMQRTRYRSISDAPAVQLVETKFVDDHALCADYELENLGATALEAELQLAGTFADADTTGRPVPVRTSTLSLYETLTSDVYVAISRPASVHVAGHERLQLRLRCGVGRTAGHAAQARQRAGESDAAGAERGFEARLDELAPRLVTDDVRLARLYAYRCFVALRALRQPDRWFPAQPMPGKLVFEGPVGAWFSAPIGLPLPLQIRELRWLRAGSAVPDTLAAWIRGDGALRSYCSDPVSAALDYEAHHPGSIDLPALYRAARSYLEDGNRRSPRLRGGGLDSFGLTVGSWVAGTEFAPDLFAQAGWDHTRSEISIAAPVLPRPGEADSPDADVLGRAFRVDTNTWQLTMLGALASLAVRLNRPASERRPLELARDRLQREFARLHRDGEGFFRSAAENGRRTESVLGFEAAFPFLFSDWGPAERRALDRLLSPTHLLADHGLRSTSPICPAFSADNRWTAGPNASVDEPFHYPCCWNGPAWNFATSWVLSALGKVARSTGDPRLSARFAEIWTRWSDAHFSIDDGRVPLAVEHYHPDTGRPYRVIPEYFHSAWIDPFLRVVLGLDGDAPRGRPLVALTLLTIQPIPWRGRLVRAELDERGVVETFEL